jgi:hypothetical protein
MAINTLTAVKCKDAKPSEKDRKIFDGYGMYLFVSAKGAKVWRMAYRFEGKPKTAVLGPYPLVSLKDARDLRDDIRSKLLNGVDPQAKVKESVTFNKALELFITHRETCGLSADYIDNSRNGLAMHIGTYLGSVQMNIITTESLLDVLLKLNAAGKYQFKPGTLRETMKMAGVKGTDKFDSATQEKLGRAKLDDTLKQAGNNPVAQQRALAKVWAAVAEPTTGKSFYDDGVNKASIQSAQLFTGGNLSAAPETKVEQAAIPATEDMSSYNKEYNKERLDAIYNYDKAKIPSKLTTDDKTSSGDTYNVDNSKKVASGSSTPPGVAASAWNDDIIRLLLMAATDSNFSATR